MSYTFSEEVTIDCSEGVEQDEMRIGELLLILVQKGICSFLRYLAKTILIYCIDISILNLSCPSILHNGVDCPFVIYFILTIIALFGAVKKSIISSNTFNMYQKFIELYFNEMPSETNFVCFSYRLFDSQNNNRGGYNGGPIAYYEGSKLQVEWYVYWIVFITIQGATMQDPWFTMKDQDSK